MTDDKPRGELDLEAPAAPGEPSALGTQRDETEAPESTIVLEDAQLEVLTQRTRPSVGPRVYLRPENSGEELLTAQERQSADGRDETSLDDKIRRQLEADQRPKRDPLLGQVIGGRFEVLEKIGAGGMGAVYRARQRGIDREVAIKVLLQEAAHSETVSRRFTIEALAVSRLKHPNTIQIFDFGKTDTGELYIAMELLEGRTLHELIRREKRLSIRRALHMIAAVAGSLSEAHGKEIVHRDLKPENIFLISVGSNSDFVKVLDFGVAKLRDGVGDGKGTLTKVGSIFGTPRYMSPEQASAHAVDARSDLYSLGVILYEMIAGRPPFVEVNPLRLLLAQANRPPPPFSVTCPELVIPREVDDLIMGLLHKDPSGRPQSAAELKMECERLARSLPEAFDTVLPFVEAEALSMEIATVAEVDLSAPISSEQTAQLGPSGSEALPTQISAPTSLPETPPPRRRRSLLLGIALGIGALGIGALLWVDSGLSSSNTSSDLSVSSSGASSNSSRGSSPVGLVVAPPRPSTPGASTPGASTSGLGEEVEVAPALVRQSIVTRPSGARVVELQATGGERELGRSPLELKRPRGERLRVRITAVEHQKEEKVLEFIENRTLELTLLRLPPTASQKSSRRLRPKTSAHEVQVHTPKPKLPLSKPKPPSSKPKPSGQGGLVDDLL